MSWAHPAAEGSRDICQGRIKTVEMEARRAVVAADDRAHIISASATSVAEDYMAIFRHLQQVGIIVGRLLGSYLRWLSQTRYVGNPLVGAMVLHVLGVVGKRDMSLANADEILLDFSRRGVLGLALLVTTVRDRGGEGVADSTAGAVPFALGRVLGIHKRSEAFEMECIFAGVAAEEITHLVALVAVVTVVRRLTVE